MTTYSARQLWSLRQNDGLLTTTSRIPVEEVGDDNLRAAWAETRAVATRITAALRETSQLMRELPKDPGTIELERGIRAEGSLVQLLVYYGFDPEVIEDGHLYDAVRDVIAMTSDFRVAAHRLDGLLYTAADGSKPQTRDEAYEAIRLRAGR